MHCHGHPGKHEICTHMCQYNALSFISKYANNSFKENSRDEHEAFIEMLVAVL